MTKQITKVEPQNQPQNQSVESLIGQAIEKGLPVETMERLFALREKVKAEYAKEQFTQALADFQKDCPIVEKNKKVLNKDGRTLRYQYASIDNIIGSIKAPLSQNGLAYSFSVEQTENKIKATCIITHIAGHSSTSSFEIPIDKEGYMTEPQKYASALTYAKRYALTNALGLVGTEEDTDATDVGEEKDVKDTKAKIIFLLRSLGHESKDKEIIVKKVKELTQLELNDKNLDEIKGRLQVLVRGKQEYDKEVSPEVENVN